MVAYADAAFLLRRAGFGGTKAEIDALLPLSRAQMVDKVLDVSTAAPDTRPSWLDDSDAVTEEWQKGYKLQLWWFDRMRTSTAPLQEKMTLFWHGHFATSNDKIYDARHMYEQQRLFRSAGLGSFRALTQQMATQPAMLLYLDNANNHKNAPNENFARELMELFTLGLDQYTQNDVEASARAWTGHNYNSATRSYQFYANRHDTSNKTFMGVTKNWDGPDIIDHITSVEPHRTTCARFIAKKLWSFFAYPNPSDAVLNAIVTPFLDADLDITTLLRAIFSHDEFYSTAARQGLLRSPAEFCVAAMRYSGVDATTCSPPWWGEDMGQQLLYPPNVSGWKQNATFISATPTWARMNFVRHLTWKRYDADGVAMLRDTLDMSVPDAISAAFDRFGIDAPSSRTRAELETWLTSQRAATKEWRDWQHINLFTLILLTPDFNLA